jgi:hypothetical protein
MTATKDAAPRTAKKKRRSTNVPGQLYGYLLQVTRSVAHLLRARPGQAVSVEHLDDVATQGPDGVIAEQDKSGLGGWCRTPSVWAARRGGRSWPRACELDSVVSPPTRGPALRGAGPRAPRDGLMGGHAVAHDMPS